MTIDEESNGEKDEENNKNPYNMKGKNDKKGHEKNSRWFNK